MDKSNVTHPVDEKLSKGKTVSLAVQHMLIAILSAIPVPLIISQQTDLSKADTTYFISAVILTSGISSLLCSIGPKAISPRVPMIMGASFSAIPICIKTINNAPSISDGFQLIAGGTIVAGIVMFLLAPAWSKLKPLFPLVVVATNTMILGIYLIPNTFHWIIWGSKVPGQVDLSNILLAVFVFLLNIFLSKILKGFVANLNILFCLIIGSVVAIAFNMVDLTPVTQANVLEPIVPFVRFGLPKFNLVTMTSFVIVAMLGMVEISGTSMGLHSIVQKEMDDKQLTKVLRTSGLNAGISGSFGAVHPVPFVQNLGLLDMTKVFSRFVVATAGGILILLSFFPQAAAFINVIPKPVLGGVSLSIFGGIIASGASMLKDVKMDGNHNKLVVGLAIGVAMLPAFYSDFYGGFHQIIQDIFGNGIVAGGLTAILLNLLFNFKEIKVAYSAKKSKLE